MCIPFCLMLVPAIHRSQAHVYWDDLAWVCICAGELKQSIDEALADGGAGDGADGSQDTVQQQIHKLLKFNPVMLFMKGDFLALTLPSQAKTFWTAGGMVAC